MKILMTFLILVTIWTHGYADESHHNNDTNISLSLPSSNTYGLLALSAAGNQLDWGVPDKVQLSVAAAFTEGGNQSLSVAVGNRFGGILLNAHFVTTINAPDQEDDYAIIVGGTMRF